MKAAAVFLFILITLNGTAHADIVVKQVNSAGSTVTLEITAGEKVVEDSTLLLNLPEGNQCPLRVKRISGTLVSADSVECKEQSSIKKGQLAELELMPVQIAVPSPTPLEVPATPAKNVKSDSTEDDDEPQVAAQEHKIHRLTGYVGLGYDSATDLVFNNASYSINGGSSTTGNFTLSGESALSLQGGLQMLSERSWGFQAGIGFEGRRDINSFSGNLGGASAGSFSTKPALQMSFIEANALYRWNLFYLPFGLSYSLPQLDAGSAGNLAVKGSIGTQFGGGFYLSDHFQLGILLRILGVTATASSGTTTYDYGYGTYSGLDFNAHYSF